MKIQAVGNTIVTFFKQLYVMKVAAHHFDATPFTLSTDDFKIL